MIVFLETPEDMAWLVEMHCAVARNYACAILHGNEDSPNKIELFARNDVRCKPTVLEIDENLNLIIKSWGERPREKS
jgi:hypothetical protein